MKTINGICFFLLLTLALLMLQNSCTNYNEELTVQDIEIFADTPAWELAKSLDKGNFSKASAVISDNPNLINYQEPYFGTTLLMRAVSMENYNAVEFLLNNGANPNIIDSIGGTALFNAISYPWNDVNLNEESKFVKILLERGANPKITYCAPLKSESESPIECGTSPLMFSVTRGYDKFRLLIEAGADINYQTKLGTTAAINALLNEKVVIAHYLIVKLKARVNKPYYYYDDDNVRSIMKNHIFQ